jgi:hypothetical protein
MISLQIEENALLSWFNQHFTAVYHHDCASLIRKSSQKSKQKVITLFDWSHFMWDTSDNPNSPHTSITKKHAHSRSNVLLREENRGKGEPTYQSKYKKKV